MCMGGPTPHTRVSISGFEWPIGQSKPRAGPELFRTDFSGPEMPFSNPENPAFRACARATSVAVACVSAKF